MGGIYLLPTDPLRPLYCTPRESEWRSYGRGKFHGRHFRQPRSVVTSINSPPWVSPLFLRRISPFFRWMSTSFPNLRRNISFVRVVKSRYCRFTHETGFNEATYNQLFYFTDCNLSDHLTNVTLRKQLCSIIIFVMLPFSSLLLLASIIFCLFHFLLSFFSSFSKEIFQMRDSWKFTSVCLSITP